MKDINNPRKWKGKVYLYFVIFIVLGMALGSYSILKWRQSGTASQKDEEVEALLTRQHGEEASEAVRKYEQTWMSLEMHNDPKTYLSDLLTGPLLQSYMNQFDFQNEDYWLIPDRLDIDGLRVIQSSNQSMKVIACINKGINKVDHNGSVIEQYPIHRNISFYVFILNDGGWKLGNVIDITDPKQALQDWDFMSQDLKDITGDIDTIIFKSCKIE